MKKKYLLGSIAIAFTLIASPFIGQAISAKESVEEAKKDQKTYENLDLFAEVFERVKSDYVEQATDKELIEAAISGMLASLDPHSSFLNADGFDDMRVQTKGEFGGLGIEVTMENGVVKVVSPIDDTPAAKANIQAGDYITFIDGEAVMGMTLEDAVEKMRGEVGSDITLTIQREGTQDPIVVTLTRDTIEIKAVRYKTYNNIGYVRITTFNDNTDLNLRKSVETIREKLGKNLEGYVIDLRNNPGGLLDQAVAVSDDFLEQGEIVSTRERDMKNVQRFTAKEGDIADGKPVIVIINNGSASASEIVAGALQDHKRAIVIGTQSFGKGSVQTIMPLAGNGALRLTTARYYTPSGASIQAKGIVPDVKVDQAKIETVKKDVFSSFSERSLRGHLTGDQELKEKEMQAKKDKKDEKNADPYTFSDNDLENDYQLRYAFDLMRGLSLQTITAKVDAKKVEETKLDATEPSDKSLKDNDSKIEKKVN